MFSFARIVHINWPLFFLIFYQRFPGTLKKEENGEFGGGFVGFVVLGWGWGSGVSSKVGKHGPCNLVGCSSGFVGSGLYLQLSLQLPDAIPSRITLPDVYQACHFETLEKPEYLKILIG